MQTKKVYDVVIAGAGPAGLMALRALHNRADVLCIDPKTEIGLPVKCGEGIRARDFDELFHGKNHDFIVNKIDENEVILEDITRKFQLSYYKVNREKFEKWLSEPVIGLIQFKTSLKEVHTKNKGYLELMTNRGVFRTRLLILASGCNYSVQKRAGMFNQELSTVVAYGGIFNNVKVDKNKFNYFFDKKYCGYFWAFPNSENEVNLGFGAFNQKKRVKETFYELKDKFGFKDAKPIREYAGIIPTMGPIKSYSNRILAAGNAAGMVYAGTGEGVSYALQSGKLAGETALKAIEKNDFSAKFLKSYEDAWSKKFGKELKAGLMFRDLLFFGYKFKKLKTLLSKPSDEEIRSLVFGKPPLKAAMLWIFLKTFYLKKTHF